MPEQVQPACHGFDVDMLIAFGAAVRSAQMAGALQRILDQSVQYATERVQFGKQISKFQAIQHSLAELAGEAAAAGAAAGMAADAIARGKGLDDQALADIAAAKVRLGEAATNGSAIAHQVHGAMGFTYEHTLHHSTRRLWSWRDEFGNEAEWSIRLGRLIAKQGADELWPFVTAA
jgi:acyl-CoA dehydrogenase